MRWYTSDNHFGHKNIIDYCGRPFGSVEEMNEAMISNWNAVVGTEDEVVHLGDIVMGPIREGLQIISKLNGRIKLLCGNHDRPWVGNGPKAGKWTQRYLDAGFDEVVVGGTLQSSVLEAEMSHFPFVGDSRSQDRHVEYRPTDRGQWLLHGHTHQTQKRFGRMIHVGVDAWDFTPVAEEQILSLIEEES